MLLPSYRKIAFLERELFEMSIRLGQAIDSLKPARTHEEILSSLEGTVKGQELEQALAGAVARLEAAVGSLKPARTHEEILSSLGEVKDEILKDNIRCRWQVLDAMDGLLYPPTYPVKCLICGHEAPKSSYEVKMSECIYSGGRLERFVCPDCGCIFGPLKILSMDERQLAAEYRQSYAVYPEWDTTVLELAAFEALNPDKGGTYLNYGAGAWNKTTAQLREKGWNVYDYEPYAPAQANAWVFKSFDEVRKMRFDGLFSNDLIEHLRHPTDDLRSMASLLKEGGRMVHGTRCYDYAYEFTRFHLFFPVGGSLDRLAANAGLRARFVEHPAIVPYPHAKLCEFTKL